MKTLAIVALSLAAAPVPAQNYASYNHQPVARLSFLRSQWPLGTGGNYRDSSLVAFWPLTAATDKAYDYSGHSASGTYEATASEREGYFTAGKTGQYASSFNASGSYLSTSTITLAGSFSLSIWLNAATPAPANDRSEEISHRAGLYLGTDRSNTQFQFSAGTSAVGNCSGGTVSAGKWQFVTGVYDGKDGRLYVDGALVAGPCSLPYPEGMISTMRVGCFNGAGCDGAGGAWKGLVNDVRVYSRALSQAEIEAIFKAENH